MNSAYGSGRINRAEYAKAAEDSSIDTLVADAPSESPPIRNLLAQLQDVQHDIFRLFHKRNELKEQIQKVQTENNEWWNHLASEFTEGVKHHGG